MSVKFVSPHHELLNTLLKFKVDFVVIGVSGINYYARNASQIISTVDYDLFIDSNVENVYRVLKALMKEDFQVAYGSSPQHLRSIMKPSRLLSQFLVKKKNVIVAEGPYHTLFELVQEISGFTFKEMMRRAVKMKDVTARIVFPVGNLEDLIESKRQANRKKDILFLKKYEDILLPPNNKR